MTPPLMLLGAGGHAKAIAELLAAQGRPVTHYHALAPCDWLGDCTFIENETEALAWIPGQDFVLGMGGVAPEGLRKRLGLLHRFRDAGGKAFSAIHPRTIVSSSATIAPGAIILAGAILQPGARLEEGAILNTGAIFEHDSRAGAGSHIAPGAIVLGGCSIGSCSMVGAGAVMLPGSSLPDDARISALTRHAGSEGR